MLGWLLLAGVAGATAPQDTAGAYRDAQARVLVNGARARRARADLSITRYHTTVRERLSAGLRALARERLVYRRETAARIDWMTGGDVKVEVLGAREVLPSLLSGPQLPHDLESYVGHLAFDPIGGEVLLPLHSTGLRHPLHAGSEGRYRFATGDTMTIRFAPDRSVRLVELIVQPRRADPRLLAGSFWLDAETYDLVRMIFRPAAARRLGGNLFSLEASAVLDRVTIEYGLSDLQWWMPRLVLAEGAVRFGSFARMPLSYEREYSDYTVEGGAGRGGVPADSAVRPCRPRFRMVIRVGRPDTTARPAPTPPDTIAHCDRAFSVAVPTDTAALLASSLLPGSVWTQGPELGSPEERERSRAIDLPEPPWSVAPPRAALPLTAMRYNRVEAFSPAVTVDVNVGPLRLDARVRMGTADLVPNWEAGIVRGIEGGEVRLGGYRRLAQVEPLLRSFSLAASLGAFVAGEDQGDYFRARGFELAGRHGRGALVEWRIFAERHRAAAVHTDFSLRRWLDPAHAFRPNLRAARADQVGASVNIDVARGLAPRGVRWGILVAAEAAAGTFDYVRPSVTARMNAPLPAGLLGLVEAGGGVAAGTVPPQRLWMVGGTRLLRGYDPFVRSGDAYWRLRTEVGTEGPVARLVLFGDAGWAGSRDEIASGRPLLASGLGASAFDGLLRVDAGRALRAPAGWFVIARFNAPL